MRKNIAIILSGGSGSRAGGEVPKQYIEINGKSILLHSIEKFYRHKLIDEIIVVASKRFFDLIKISISEFNNKPIKVVEGGEERYHSSLNAIKSIKYEMCNILIHDSVRALVSDKIISNVILKLEKYSCVNTIIPSSDTIVEVNNGKITKTLDRSKLYQVQTPQGFHLEIIKEAYQIALEDNQFAPTDDCSIIQQYLPNIEIGYTMGEPYNIKITYPYDFTIFKALCEDNL